MKKYILIVYFLLVGWWQYLPAQLDFIPIQADYAGYKSHAGPGKFVQVNLMESDGKEQVVIE